jgi:quinol monooxygenase YgiN
MAIIVHFSPSGLDKSKYDDAIRRLEQAGAGNPPGRLYHCFYDSGGALKVVEVWDSQQSFERHGQTLMPILKSVGIDAGQPVVSPVHNVISGQ